MGLQVFSMIKKNINALIESPVLVSLAIINLLQRKQPQITLSGIVGIVIRLIAIKTMMIIVFTTTIIKVKLNE